MSDFLDFKALERPKSPNTYLVAPAGFADQAKPDEAGPVFDCSPESLFGRVEALIGMRKDWRLESLDAQAGRIYFSFVPAVQVGNLRLLLAYSCVCARVLCADSVPLFCFSRATPASC